MCKKQYKIHIPFAVSFLPGGRLRDIDETFLVAR